MLWKLPGDLGPVRNSQPNISDRVVARIKITSCTGRQDQRLLYTVKLNSPAPEISSGRIIRHEKMQHVLLGPISLHHPSYDPAAFSVICSHWRATDISGQGFILPLLLLLC